MISHDIIETLRVPPMLGRSFTAEDDTRGATPVELVSFAGRHAGDGIDSHGIKRLYLGLLPDAARDDELLCGRRAQNGGYLGRKALHRALSIDMGVKKGGGEIFQPGDGFLG